MTGYTPHYEGLKKGLSHAEKVVGGVYPYGCKTDLQHLKLQSFILLAHAVIEQYLEELCLEVARDARTIFVREGVITKALVGLITSQVLAEKSSGKGSRRIGSDMAKNLDVFSRDAFNSYTEVIKSNHGIKKDNLKSLFFPIGIDPLTVDLALANTLDAFGTTRGLIAHKFAIRRENTLSAVQSELAVIVRDLTALDREAMSSLQMRMAEGSVAVR